MLPLLPRPRGFPKQRQTFSKPHDDARAVVLSLERANSRCTSKALENKFRAELNVAIFSGGLRDVAERSGIPSRIRTSEIRMVENVEHFRAELEFEPLLNRKFLKDRKISIHEPGSDENVASGIA